LLCRGPDQDYARASERGRRDRRCHLRSARVRESDSQHRGLEREARGSSGSHPREDVGAVDRLLDIDPERGRAMRDRATGRLALVRDEQTPVSRGSASLLGAGIRAAIERRARERDRVAERAPPPRLPGGVDGSSHQLDEPLRDREAETCAAVLASRRAVSLGEGLKQALLLF